MIISPLPSSKGMKLRAVRDKVVILIRGQSTIGKKPGPEEEMSNGRSDKESQPQPALNLSANQRLADN